MMISDELKKVRKQVVLGGDSPPHIFAVVTWGCAASSWLARALNSHPDIFCVHAENSLWSVLGEARYLDGAEYLTVVGCQGCTHTAAGDVHGVSRHTVPEIKAEFGEQFSCAVVVREPISRLHSQLSLFKKRQHLRSWNLDYLEDTIKKLALPNDSYPTHLFVHGANMLNAIVEEHLIAPVYRSEDLTSNPEILCKFVDHITNGKIEADLPWATTSVSREKLNAHSESAVRSLNPESSNLEDWQMETIRKVVLPQAWELYQKLNYPIPNFI
jgi:hypothetical protein